jgi:hypothetical protein
LRTRILSLLLFTASLTICGHANIVVNPGFETGDFTGWTTNSWGVSQVNPHSGDWAAFTVCVGADCTDPASPFNSFLYQDLTTISGAQYNLSFWFDTGDFPTEGSELSVYWGGVLVADFVNVDTSFLYQQAVIPNLTATGSTTRLEFFGRQDPSVLFLDDIDVEAVSTGVPEPAPRWLVFPALLVFVSPRIRRVRFPVR